MSVRAPLFSRFRRNAVGSATKQWAIIAGSIGVASVIAANVADQAARHGALPQIVWRTPMPPTPAGIDYNATASIAASTRLDPCTGRVK